MRAGTGRARNPGHRTFIERKKRGAGQVDQHPDITHRGRQRHNSAIVGTVKAALRQNRLLFAYQPVVFAATGIVDYFECLLRIRDEAGNVLPGAEFITASSTLV